MKPVLWIALALFSLSPMMAGAGIFDKKPKADPAKRVEALIQSLHAAPDADDRARAAEELREFDAAKFPEIVPNLIVALEHDSDATVRREAAQSLGRIKPTSPEVLQSLETAADKDKSVLVRVQARASKLGYRVEKPRPQNPSPPIQAMTPTPAVEFKPMPKPPASPEPIAPAHATPPPPVIPPKSTPLAPPVDLVPPPPEQINVMPATYPPETPGPRPIFAPPHPGS